MRIDAVPCGMELMIGPPEDRAELMISPWWLTHLLSPAAVNLTTQWAVTDRCKQIVQYKNNNNNEPIIFFV